jgi:gluconolactonase
MATDRYTISRRQLLLSTAAGTAGALGTIAASQAASDSVPDLRVVASGLRFPESPIPLEDGSTLLVEIERGTLTRVLADGRNEVVADLGGGPNGAAIGPDKACYVVNNGGFAWRRDPQGYLFPAGSAPGRSSGRIDRVDVRSGRFETLYTNCNGIPLSAPNDLVFDDRGGFYFTDNGRHLARSRELGGLYYALADGSSIEEVVYPLDSPNGVALSPDGKTVYVALTTWRMLLAFPIIAPGKVEHAPGFIPGRVVSSVGGLDLFDSMAVDEAGNLNVATVVNGGVLTVAPDGKLKGRIAMPDPLTTSIRFGGPDRRTAFVTLGATGRLVTLPWPVAGLAGIHAAHA